MNRAKRTVQLALGVVLLAKFPGGQTKKETFVPANDVSFTISTKASFAAGEPVIIKYAIENVSNAAVYVPRTWEAKCTGRPHVWAWLENSVGRHFIPGYGGSCSGEPKTVTERMQKEAVLLKPGERLDGVFRLDTTLFGGFQPGEYRVEAVLYCWIPEDFDAAQWEELSKMGAPFVFGETRATTRTALMPPARPSS